MNEEDRWTRNEYYKKYKKKNPEKVNQIQEGYWEKKVKSKLVKAKTVK